MLGCEYRSPSVAPNWPGRIKTLKASKKRDSDLSLWLIHKLREK